MARKKKDTRLPAPTNLCQIAVSSTIGEGIAFYPKTGGEFVGTVDQVNALLAAMNYHPVAIRSNMMSGLRYIEAQGTPNYCSPASEAYWSM